MLYVTDPLALFHISRKVRFQYKARIWLFEPSSGWTSVWRPYGDPYVWSMQVTSDSLTHCLLECCRWFLVTEAWGQPEVHFFLSFLYNREDNVDLRIGAEHSRQRKILNPMFSASSLRYMPSVFYRVTHKVRFYVKLAYSLLTFILVPWFPPSSVRRGEYWGFDLLFLI